MDLKIPALFLAMCVFVSSTVSAAPEARDPQGYTWEGYSGKLGAHRGMFLNEDDVATLEKLDAAGQDKFYADYYDRDKALGPAERKKIYDAKRKEYNALTPEQQNNLRARMEKLRVAMVERRKVEWDAKLAAAKVKYAERERTYYATLKDSQRKVLLRYKELIRQGMDQKAAMVEVTKEAAANSPSIKRQGEKKPY